MQELSQGTQLAGRYTLVRRLGGDTDSHTWLAKDRLTRASVALKIASGDADNSARLRAEWQTGIRLMHAHIVRAFEFHEEPDCAFYSQQFIDGPDLGALTGRPAADILGPVALLIGALAYLHGKGVVHRDLKASMFCWMRTVPHTSSISACPARSGTLAVVDRRLHKARSLCKGFPPQLATIFSRWVVLSSS